MPKSHSSAIWGFVTDGAVWPDLVIVFTPILHFLSRVVKTHEPVGVQAFRSELAVEALDEAVIVWLAWSRVPQAGA